MQWTAEMQLNGKKVNKLKQFQEINDKHSAEWQSLKMLQHT